MFTEQTETETFYAVGDLINLFSGKNDKTVREFINCIATSIRSIEGNIKISSYTEHFNGMNVLRLGEKPTKNDGMKQTVMLPIGWNQWEESKGICGDIASVRFIISGEVTERTEKYLSELQVAATALNDGIKKTPSRTVWDTPAKEPVQIKWGIVASGAKSYRMLTEIDLFAKSRMPVLVTGETGCGKELVASALHKGSERKGRFFAVNCAAISRELIESELFGHTKGAFTGAVAKHDGFFQSANNGTLFLDEIGELSLELQAKLLRVLQENKVRRVGSNQEEDINVRIVTATNRDLFEMVQKGEFRRDLYYRLHVLQLHITPLRERREEIPHLVDFLLKKLSEELEYDVTISREAVQKLMLHEFPGNVRELVNLLESGVVYAGNNIIQEEHLKFAGNFQNEIGSKDSEKIIFTESELLTAFPSEAATGSLSLSEAKSDILNLPVEKALIEMLWGKNFEEMEDLLERVMYSYALSLEDGKMNSAAEHLGIERSTFLRRVKKLGIEKKDWSQFTGYKRIGETQITNDLFQNNVISGIFGSQASTENQSENKLAA